MAVATLAEPILIDLDERTWKEHLDRAESWFGNVLMTQARFRKMLADSVAKIQEPRIKRYLEEMLEGAERHEEQAKELYRRIGRDRSKVRQSAGAAMAKGSEMLADAVGMAGGATGSWKDLRHLLLVNMDAIGAFGIAEQLGYALGLPEVAELAFSIVNQKTRDQLLLQEYMLEMGPVAILYHANV